MVESAYIHIPFCRQKCRYCSFVSFPLLERKIEYLEALRNQIVAEYKGEPLRTLYFGGGTPSLLEVEEIEALADLFVLQSGAEVTIEINPETVDEDFFLKLAKTRVNRLSIGSQTFDDEILGCIGRKHKGEDVFRVVRLAQNAGFDNISLDFIYGLPKQTLNGFLDGLKTAAGLGVQHISLYGLKIEEGCYFYKNMPENLADDELQAQMYLEAIRTLEVYGFEHYEISNFSRMSKCSKHNVNYWKNEEYYGFGLAAHGYVSGSRYSNIQDFKGYLINPLVKESNQVLSLQEKLEEEIFLGLRLTQGVDIEKINAKYNVDFMAKYGKILDKYLGLGYLKLSDGFCSFTNDGFLISSYILSDFIE